MAAFLSVYLFFFAMPAIYENPSAEQLPELLKRPLFDSSKLEAAVSAVLKDIEEQGDDAVRRYTSKFDGVDIDAIQVTDAEIAAAEALVSDDLKNAIQMAKENIATFHASQKEEVKVVETRPGVRCWRKSLPIERVGLYIPGGSAPLFSTVLMLGVPAKLVGCKEVVLCSPPNKEGKLHPAILYAAKTVGIDKVFRVGGVQAIGGMAYGTATIPKVCRGPALPPPAPSATESRRSA